MKSQFLLLEDVDGLGRSGDIVTVKRMGFARNFLLPEKKAVIAEKHTLRLQDKLKEERAQKAIVDKKDAEAIAAHLADKSVKTVVKIDAEGHMYGSVTTTDIANLINEQHGTALERKNVILLKPIKSLGSQLITLKLKEGVPSSIILEVVAEEKPA